MNSGKLCRATCNLAARQLILFNHNLQPLSTSVVCDDRFTTNKRKPPRYSNISKPINPGIGKRLQLLKADTPDVDRKIALEDEDLEELEGDFLNAREMQEYHVRTESMLKFRETLKITERKYFRPSVEPNMLTWSEKNQIKLLHSEDPVEWNIDKLSESFPATPEIIKKVLKSSWKPSSDNRVKAHDQVVSRNWKAFNEGTLQISNLLLKKHLKNFTGRLLLPRDSDDSGTFVKQLPKPEETEFADIIHNYKQLKANTISKETSSALSDDNNSHDSPKCTNDSPGQCSASLAHRKADDLNVDKTKGDPLPLPVNNKLTYTLDKLREEMRIKRAEIGIKIVNEQDKELLRGETSLTAVHSYPTSESTTMYKDNIQIDTSTKSENRLMHRSASDSCLVTSPIKRRIHIPKSKVKAGFLYKVNDCFYSHDGFFLYRLPGKVSENCE